MSRNFLPYSAMTGAGSPLTAEDARELVREAVAAGATAEDILVFSANDWADLYRCWKAGVPVADIFA